MACGAEVEKEVGEYVATVLEMHVPSPLLRLVPCVFCLCVTCLVESYKTAQEKLSATNINATYKHIFIRHSGFHDILIMLREASKATNKTVLRIFAKKDNKFISFMEHTNIHGIYVCTEAKGPTHKVKANLSKSLFGNTLVEPFYKTNK
uniref:Uncharacterized protein n=1 Tax=Glossina austeni TaxID=7395 RepID=A0A1A9V492_GLOAU